MKMRSIEQISATSWEGLLETGEHFIILYEHDRLTLRVGGLVLYAHDIVRMPDEEWDFELTDVLSLIGCLEVSDASVA